MKRDDIADEYKWNLKDLFQSDDEWEKELNDIYAQCEKIATYSGRLGEGPQDILHFLEEQDELLFHFERVYVYANEAYHEDTANAKYQAFSSKADSARVAVAEALSFSEPEILAIPEERLSEFYKEEPALLKYQRELEIIFRRKEHTLTAAEENILAQAGELAQAPERIYSDFSNADLKFPSIADVEGNRVRITHGNFIKFMRDKDRSVRKRVFNNVYETYGKWGNTIAAIYTSSLRKENFYAKARKYESVRAMHLSGGNIPEAVYDNLIEAVHRHLPALHRYTALRKKILGVEKLHMYDLYVPLVANVEEEYSFKRAKETVAAALSPMGEDYIKVLKEGFCGGWIDVYENDNKRSGAYSWAAYGTHPYVLLNYQDDLEGVFTLAHEMGHAIHTYFSNKTQPFTYADYMIFVAEVASTCNECLLNHYLLEQEKEEKKLRYLRNHYLEAFRTTLFRQTMFAEFEQITHSRMAKGESLTKEDLNRIYHELNELYYGPDMVVDPLIDNEWMRIPHFYNAFYVYQYATGYSAAVAFSNKILKEGAPAVEKYINNFLCGGGSRDPIELLSAAGVDMSTPEPVEEALKVFEQQLNLFEKEME